MASHDTQLYINPQARASVEYGQAQREILNQEAFAVAKAEITSWPGYAQTPLIGLDGLAQAKGVGALWCKHEGFRFGIGSFKPTGPPYAMLGVLKGEVQKATGEQAVSTQDLVAGKYAEITRNIVVAAATSGNHGRAMAWGARTFGCRAVLYMNDGVSAGREMAIVGYGGEVVRVEGTYDRVVEQLHQDAEVEGYFVISDQVTAAYPQVPRAIMQGYAMVADEVVEQLDKPPTHVFVPGGGGIFAGACCGRLWQRYGRERPRLVVVEPTASCCLYESARVGRAVKVGAATSVMDGLVVEEASAEPWAMLNAGAFAFLTVPDRAAVDAMREAAQPEGSDPSAVIGDTGSAAWAGFAVAASDAEMRCKLALDGDSRVVVVVTEGATDPVVYRAIVGRDPDEVMAGP
jgi:diaminopropionate ammonia-lyase